jgi:hypothetical protein
MILGKLENLSKNRDTHVQGFLRKETNFRKILQKQDTIDKDRLRLVKGIEKHITDKQLYMEELEAAHMMGSDPDGNFPPKPPKRNSIVENLTTKPENLPQTDSRTTFYDQEINHQDHKTVNPLTSYYSDLKLP